MLVGFASEVVMAKGFVDQTEPEGGVGIACGGKVLAGPDHIIGRFIGRCTVLPLLAQIRQPARLAAAGENVRRFVALLECAKRLGKLADFQKLASRVECRLRNDISCRPGRFDRLVRRFESAA